MWRFKEGACGMSKQEHAQWMKEHLEALPAIIPEIQSLEFGINALASPAAYDAVLITTFRSKEEMERYKNHPAHVAISNHCKQVREERVVVDFFVE